MKIWFDLDNSPHVLFFAPILRELCRRRIEVLITVREFAQTRQLAKQHGMSFTTIGRHYGSGAKIIKVAGTLYRACQLAKFIGSKQITAAVSHGSRAMVVASRILGIPSMTLYDYEFVSCRLYNMLSRRILVPDVIPEARLVSQGLKSSKLVRYPGLKEEAYVYELRPDPNFMERLGVRRENVIVTVRPPATWAHYHDELSTTMFVALMKKLQNTPNVQVIIPARTTSQANELRVHYGLTDKRFHIFTQPVDGLSLMWSSDLVFSGGGTMTREAALLGIKVYSIFGGRIGAADESLARSGKLTILREPAGIDVIEFAKRSVPCQPPPDTKHLAISLADEIQRFAQESARC